MEFVGGGNGLADCVDAVADVRFFGRPLRFETLVLGEEGRNRHDERFDGQFGLSLGQVSDILDEVARDPRWREGMIGEAAHSESWIVVVSRDDFGNAILLKALQIPRVELESNDPFCAAHSVGVLPVVGIGSSSARRHVSLRVIPDNGGDDVVSLLFANERLLSIGIDHGAVVECSGVNGEGSHEGMRKLKVAMESAVIRGIDWGEGFVID